MDIKSYLTNSRFYILLLSVLIAVGVYFHTKLTLPEESSQVLKLTQTYALITLTYLYIAIITSPVTRFFTFLPFRGLLLRIRRPIGVSAFMFALLHSSFAFFGLLGGFEGLTYLTPKYIFAISLSSISLFILLLMAVTSFDYMVEKLTFPKWKILHRFVYIVGLFTIIHALMLGSHFANLSNLIPQIFFVALAFLLILESLRLDNFLSQKLTFLPRFGLFFSLLFLILGALITYFILS